MKKIILLIITLVLLVNVTAQEMGFNYKALVSDASGDSIANADDVWIQFAILQDGSVIYQEIYDNETTDVNGILITNIGEGVASIGVFSEIDWSVDYSLRVSIDAGSGVSVYTPTPFKAVPYAKYADYGKDEDDDPNNEIQTLSFDGTSLQLTDGGTVDLSTLAGTGTDNQALTLEAGNTLTLEDGGTVNLSPYLDNTDTQLTETQVDNYVSDNGYITTEVDGSITNEIQTISFDGTSLELTDGGTVDLSTLAGTGTDNQALTLEVGNTLTLEDGGTVNLSPYLDNTDTQLTETQVDNYVSDNGYITTEVDGSITNELQTLSLDSEGVLHLTVPGSADNLVTLPTGSGVNELNDLSDVLKTSNSLYLGDLGGGIDDAGFNIGIGGATLAGSAPDAFKSIAIGYWSMEDSHGNNNIGIGYQSLIGSDGSFNIGIGNDSFGLGGNNGNRNIGLGEVTLSQNSNGDDNIALGTAALSYNDHGNQNIGIGSYSLLDNQDGSNNIAIGYEAFKDNDSGSNNITIGQEAGNYFANGSSNIVIGHNTPAPDYLPTYKANRLVIGKTSDNVPLIEGIFEGSGVITEPSVQINGHIMGKSDLSVTNTGSFGRDVRVGESLTSPESGTADMKAYVYGWINSNGTIAMDASSDGFVLIHGGVGSFTIEFDTPVSIYEYIVITSSTGHDGPEGIAISYSPGHTTHTYNYSDSFSVTVLDKFGELADRPFQFVVYKR